MVTAYRPLCILPDQCGFEDWQFSAFAFWLLMVVMEGEEREERREKGGKEMI